MRWFRYCTLALLAVCFCALIAAQLYLHSSGESAGDRIARHLGADVRDERQEIVAAADEEELLFQYLTLEAPANAALALYRNGERVGDFGGGLLAVKVGEGDTLSVVATTAGLTVTITDLPAALDSDRLTASVVTVDGAVSFGSVHFR